MTAANETSPARHMANEIEEITEAVGFLSGIDSDDMGDYLDGEELQQIEAARVLLGLDSVELLESDDSPAEGLDDWAGSGVLADCLEMKVTATKHLAFGDWTIDTVVIVMSTGGPHVEIVTYSTGSTFVESRWWGDNDSVELDTQAGHIIDLCFGVDSQFDME